MERLTDKNHNAINKCSEYSSCYSCHKENCYIKEIEEKLGELEDVLEKYGIKNAEELDKRINSIRTNTLIDIENKEILELENANLKSELAELKQKAIVPKFKVGQEIYIVCDFNINRIVYGWKIADYEYYKQLYIVVNKDGIDWLPEEKIFATKEEAEQKLAEIKGEKDE